MVITVIQFVVLLVLLKAPPPTLLLRTSFGVQATHHLKTTGVQYKKQGVKNKLVKTRRYTSDRAMQVKTAPTSKFCQTSDGNAKR